MKCSAEKLKDEVDMTARNFGLEVRERLWFCVDKYDVKPETATKVCATFPELGEAVAGSLGGSGHGRKKNNSGPAAGGPAAILG